MDGSTRTDYLQLLTPADECARHGREYMALMLHQRGGGAYVTDAQGHTTVIAEPTEPIYVCVACLMLNTENERKRAEAAEARLRPRTAGAGGTGGRVEAVDPRARWDVEVARRLRRSQDEGEQ